MSREEINIVWLKRDLRTQDHLPLQQAEQEPLPYLILFLFEPSLLSHPDTSLRHLQFQYHSIRDMNGKLKPSGQQVHMLYSEAISCFERLLEEFRIRQVFSYQESGIALTYERDKQIAALFKRRGIRWQQFQRDGIIRGIRDRKDWDRRWFETMHAPLVRNSYTGLHTLAWQNPFPLPPAFLTGVEQYPSAFQPAGESFALKYLHSFASLRGRNYNRHISKPLESRSSCARLSPYLSWGNISVKQAYQYVREQEAQHPPGFSLNNFLVRLKWHCHFIQKFETDCSYETRCLNAGYELLPHELQPAWLEAWEQGQTGFPLVDACMRCLAQTGWLNFRMRAMLVSFLCHPLDQDWRQGVYHLARLFLDYEPGIHYPQFQMQAGSTGINTIRIYNPVKQGQDHDPQGIFIKSWLPVLQQVPDKFIHEPHRMTPMEQKLYGVNIGQDYPAPILDYSACAARARKKIWGHRSHPLVQEENRRILQIHTRRG